MKCLFFACRYKSRDNEGVYVGQSKDGEDLKVIAIDCSGSRVPTFLVPAQVRALRDHLTDILGEPTTRTDRPFIIVEEPS